MVSGLHISLGIFQRLFDLLEDACHCLDLQMVTTSTSTAQQSAVIQQFVQNLERLSDLQEERATVEQRAAVAEQTLTLTAVNQSQTFTTTPALVSAMVKEAAKCRKELEHIVR